ncbi:restriction endonuclease subunit S [Campylobacter concisus]|uniref:restriction endonuclease subunit S n=1 Tax=Campylobacter concisus TaxID=199 RepID=UPI00130D73FF|nr:restriction endonuclease subunit S [Campylobacter concisus]
MSEFKNLPSGWKVVRLDKVAPLQRGYDLPTNNIKEGLYPVVYSNGILRFHNEFKAKGPGVITGRSGTIGKVVYVEEDYWPHNTSLWVTNFYDNNPKFIYYMYINLNLARFSAGSGVPTLNRNDIHAQTIPLPPLDEQEKIAEILSTWDEAINLTINLIESKKQFKKALMQNLLTAKIRFLQFKDEWRETKLSEICDISTGTSKSRFIGDGKFYIVDMGSITQDGLLNLTKTTNLSQDFLDCGDLVMPKDDIGGGKIIGKVAVIDKDNTYVLSDHIFRIKTTENSNFLAYLINSDLINKKIRREVSGTAQLGLGKRTIENLKIKLPNLKEQQKIAEVLTTCDDEINLLNLKLENLKKQKQGLMQKLLSGKVRARYV